MPDSPLYQTPIATPGIPPGIPPGKTQQVNRTKYTIMIRDACKIMFVLQEEPLTEAAEEEEVRMCIELGVPQIPYGIGVTA